MNLRELRSVLTRSDPSEWSKVDSDGPLYRNGFVVSGLRDDGRITDVYWHHSAAVYREDIDLTIQWGMDMDPTRDRDDWHFIWQEKLISKRVSPYRVDAFWRGVLVDRYALISVDNGHGLVPFPHTSGSEPDWYDAVTEREVAVARLVEGLDGVRLGVDRWVAQLDFKVEPDED